MNIEKTALVIDDDPSFNRVLCRALDRRAYTTHAALNASDALRQATQTQPELIVLDLNLAGESGLTLLQTLKQSCPHSQIVILTGYASIATAVEAIKLGATHYLAKPVDVDELLAVCRNAPDKFIRHQTLAPPTTPLSVERMEWEHIQRVMLDHDGNISATARALKMHRRTLQRKLSKNPAKT